MPQTARHPSIAVRQTGGGTPLRMLRSSRLRIGTPGFPWPLLLLTGLALLLRAARLDFQPLWWDEGYSVWFATHPLGQMAALTAQDIHPPLYYALVSLWTAVLGQGPVAFRLFSVLAGMLAVPVIYAAGRRIFGIRAAYLAAFLLAIHPLHIYYSQEVRMYGLVALWSAGILAAAWQVFGSSPPGQPERSPHEVGTPPKDLRAYAAYILLTTLALYTQYYAVFLPIGLTLYALWRWRRDGRALLRWLIAQGVVALLYLPWVIYAAPRLVLYVSQKVVADADRPLGLLAYLARHLAAFIAGHLEGTLAPLWPYALLLLVPLGVGLALRFVRLERNRLTPRLHSGNGAPSPVALLLTVLGTALLLGWLIGLRYPFFPERGERLLLLALPAFVLLAAAALESLLVRWRRAGFVTLGLIGAVVGASLWGFYNVPRYTDDYRSLIARTVEQGLPGDTVFCVYPWQVGYWRSYTAHLSGSDAPDAILSPAQEWGAVVAASLDDALARGRIWFPAHLALGAILETQIEAHLAGRALPFANAWYGPGTRLSAWAADAGVAGELAPPAAGQPWARFVTPGAGMLELTGVSASTQPVPAANAVTPVALTWGGQAARNGLAVSVRLTDDLGQLWAQHDYEPPGVAQPARDRLGLLIPAGAPPGRYHVELSVRLKESDRPLDALGADGTSLGTAARLYDLEVLPADRPLGPERLPIETRTNVELGDGLRFLGYSLDAGPVVPGETRKVSLFWSAPGQPSADYTAFVQLLGRDGSLAANWEAPPGAAYPTSAWTPGTLIRTQAFFRAPAALEDGLYPLIAGLFRTTDGTRLLTADGGDHVTLAQVTVRGRVHEMAAPQAQFTTDVQFGEVAKLVGYDLSVRDVVPGGSFGLTLHWQALAATERPYSVFVHLLDAAGEIRGYGDSEPGRGAYPTSGWLTGEYLADTHTVNVQADAEAGEYRIAVGFYDPGTGARLTLPDGADRLVLEQTVRVARDE